MQADGQYPGQISGITDDNCYVCHMSAYQGAPGHVSSGFPTDCEQCHSVNTWTGASFSHASFQMRGIHGSLSCNQCHTDGQYPGQISGITDDNCYVCHMSAYQGAPNHINSNYPHDCTQCHTVNTFTGASFSHQSFQLRGIHATLSCNTCHSTGYPGQYSGITDDNCFACHESDYNSEHRSGSTPHDCTQCHSLNTFNR